MIYTLITGIDGAGKSTVLKKLETKLKGGRKVIHVPHSKQLYFENNPKLTEACAMVYNLNKHADEKGEPRLKAFALVSSMLLFKRVVSESVSGFDFEIKEVFSERHPVIDTGVYALFYAPSLLPDSLSKDILKQLDAEFEKELIYCLDPVKSKISSEDGILFGFAEFLYDWFHIRKKTEPEDLEELFGIKAPDRIFYLKAKPEILFNRISKRNFREVHESVEVFEKLDAVYTDVFTRPEKLAGAEIGVINADRLDELEQFVERLVNETI